MLSVKDTGKRRDGFGASLISRSTNTGLNSAILDFMGTKKKIRKYIDKWTFRLGLRWWDIELHLCYKNKDNQKVFTIKGENHDVTRVAGRIFADWRYSTINLYLYLPTFKGKTDEKIQEIVLHELCHALVNEMRDGGIDHEERVVSGLTRAFIWTEMYSTGERKHV